MIMFSSGIDWITLSVMAHISDKAISKFCFVNYKTTYHAKLLFNDFNSHTLSKKSNPSSSYFLNASVWSSEHFFGLCIL